MPFNVFATLNSVLFLDGKKRNAARGAFRADWEKTLLYSFISLEKKGTGTRSGWKKHWLKYNSIIA